MSARALPPAIGATENALRALLVQILAESAIGGYEEWVYLNLCDRTDDRAGVEDAVADALKHPRTTVAELRAHLAEAGLLDVAGSLTALAREQLQDRRARVEQVTAALSAGIDPDVLQTTVDTLELVRRRAEQASATAVG